MVYNSKAHIVPANQTLHQIEDPEHPNTEGKRMGGNTRFLPAFKSELLKIIVNPIEKTDEKIYISSKAMKTCLTP